MQHRPCEVAQRLRGGGQKAAVRVHSGRATDAADPAGGYQGKEHRREAGLRYSSQASVPSSIKCSSYEAPKSHISLRPLLIILLTEVFSSSDAEQRTHRPEVKIAFSRRNTC